MSTQYQVQSGSFTKSGYPDHTGAATTIPTTGPVVVLPDPGVIPQLADSAADNCSVYYSTTQSALVFKDPSGTVHLITLAS